MKKSDLDWVFVGSALLLSLLGLFQIYTLSPHHFFPRQLSWVGIGTFLLFLFSQLRKENWQKLTYPLYFLSLLFLLLVLYQGKGESGAHRWLRVGKIGFQPSELVKLSLLLVLSDIFTREKVGVSSIVTSFFFILPPSILVAVQPDMGTALIFPLLWFAYLFLSGVSLKILLGIGGAGVSFAPILYLFLKPYQKRRLAIFFNPGEDPLGAGWHILQSKIAIGSGKILGKGVREATQAHLRFLPQPATDFIYASWCEQWGFIGASVLFALYLTFVYRGIKTGMEKGRSFGGLFALGFIFLVFLQTFVNIGMSTGLLPVTGVPLPFFSYGGTSTIIFLAGTGIVAKRDRI